MARVTVEDCVEIIPNRYELVLVAAQRARDISSGAVLTIERDNDKNPVISLREIAQESVSPDELKEALIKGFQKAPVVEEEPEEVLTDLVLPDPKMGDEGLIGGGSMKDLSRGGEDDDDGDELGDDADGLTVYEDESFLNESDAASEDSSDDSSSEGSE